MSAQAFSDEEVEYFRLRRGEDEAVFGPNDDDY